MVWKIIGLITAGVLGGVFGGMGMGGGTLLIPLLALFCNVPQHTAQAVNLVSFVPMALIALAIHIKKKSVDFKGVLFIIIPACIVSVGTAMLAQMINADILGMLFGIFLGLLGLSQITAEIVAIIKARRNRPGSPASLRVEEEKMEAEKY